VATNSAWRVEFERRMPPGEPGELKRAIPRVVRRYVDARDGDRCSFPGCTHRACLEADHFDGWKNGHDPRRLGKLCRPHHVERGRGYFRVETGEDGARRFFLQDGTYVGAAGDRSRADAREEFVATNSTAPRGLPEPLGPELEDALKALVRLEYKEREARERLVRALTAQPGLAHAGPGEVVRAVLAAS
jgi:hypothetical protein